MEFRLLGPVEAHLDGERIDLGPRKQRFAFAVLALDVNRPVPVARLVELTWPESAPRTAEHAIRVSMSRLRSSLGRGGSAEVDIVRHGSGYLLRTDPTRVDAHRFRVLLEQSRETDSDERRVELLEQGLRLWTGPALDGSASPEIRERLCLGLDEARLTAIEERFDAKLRLGRHRELLDELPAAVDANPLRERLVGQLMLALYRAGRAGDALATYRAARDRLVHELGLDPGPELRGLEHAVLRDDPAIAPPDAVRQTGTAVVAHRSPAPPDQRAAGVRTELTGRVLPIGDAVVVLGARLGRAGRRHSAAHQAQLTLVELGADRGDVGDLGAGLLGTLCRRASLQFRVRRIGPTDRRASAIAVRPRRRLRNIDAGDD